MNKSKQGAEVLVISEIKTQRVTMYLKGASPMIMHRFSQKAWQQLLLGTPPKNRAEQASRLKHDPIAEFRGALYRNRDDKRPTLFHVPNGMFHGALASTATDIPGAAKAEIERLTRVVDVNIDFYGVPQFFMAMVRNSGMGHAPDVRTRPIFPEWACEVTIQYTRPKLTEQVIGNLLGAAGVICGIGDWRPQKGGPYGTWELTSPNDEDYKRIVMKQGRKAQQAAWDSPTPFDVDTEELFLWYQDEVLRRQMDSTTVSVVNGGRKGKKPRVVIEDNDANIVNAIDDRHA